MTIPNTVLDRYSPAVWRVAAMVMAMAVTWPAPVTAEEIHWTAPIQWTPWEQAESKAKAENKPICLVVYANWCPKCRSIAPLFNDPALLAASKRAVMVLQNDEEKPGWLTSRFSQSGNYVPRIFFVNKTGGIDDTLNSGHPRFPYFYRPNAEGIAKLVTSIHAAATKAGDPIQAAAPQAAKPQTVAPKVAVNSAQAGAQGGPDSAATSAVSETSDPIESSDLPVLLGLMLTAIFAVWFVGRNSDGKAAE